MGWMTVIYFDPPSVQGCLDTIVYLANPDEKNSAHLTIRGPSDDKPDIETINQQLSGTELSVLGAASFFEGNQNTVFLRCDSLLLPTVWHKPNYAYNPHITLYDGPSRSFAERLVAILNQHRIFGLLRVGRVGAIRLMRGQKSFDLRLGVPKERIHLLTGMMPEQAAEPNLPVWKRLHGIERAATHLGSLLNPHLWSTPKRLTARS